MIIDAKMKVASLEFIPVSVPYTHREVSKRLLLLARDSASRPRLMRKRGLSGKKYRASNWMPGIKHWRPVGRRHCR